MLLQRQPNQKATDLAGQLGVSVRTLHRYVSMLDAMGIPIYSERGPYGGFSLVRGYKMPPLMFSPEEAVAVSLGTSLVSEIWGSLYHEAAAGALAKLENVLPDEQRRETAWAKRALVATGLHRAGYEQASPVLEKLRQATREHKQVNILYQAPNKNQAEARQIDTYALVHRSGWWYVVAFCHLRKAMRSFRVDRITGLEISDDSFSIPESFDIHDYLDIQFKFEPQIKIQLRFLPQYTYLASYIKSAWETSEQQPDGSLIVSHQATDIYWAASFVMSFGPAVIVLAPEELRTLIIEWAKTLTDIYKMESGQ